MADEEIVLLASGFKDPVSILALLETASSGTAAEGAAEVMTTAPGSTALNSCIAFEQYFGLTKASSPLS